MAVPSAIMLAAMKEGARFSDIRNVFPESVVILQGVVAEEQPAIDRAQDLVAMGLIYERWLSPNAEGRRALPEEEVRSPVQ